MTLGLPARAERALHALHLGHWLLVDADYVPVHHKVRVSFEKPSGEMVKIEFKIEPTEGMETEDWIEEEIIRRSREFI